MYPVLSLKRAESTCFTVMLPPVTVISSVSLPRSMESCTPSAFFASISALRSSRSIFATLVPFTAVMMSPTFMPALSDVLP